LAPDQRKQVFVWPTAVASKAAGVMAFSARDLDATAYPANNQTTTARLVAHNLLESLMAKSSSLNYQHLVVL